MAKRLQFRRGTTAQTNAFTGALSEVTVDTNKNVLVVHDGVTVGGLPVAARANTDGTISLIKKDGTVITTIPATGLLNNTLTSTATDQAATAAQAKVLKDLVDTKLTATAAAVSADKLTTARNISLTGDGTATISFNGSANASGAFTLANSGISAGTYKSVTVDTKGRVTAGADVVTGLVTATSATGTANAATSNTNTFLNVTEKVGSATASTGSSTQVTGAGTVTVTSDTAGKLIITGAQTITGNAGTATTATKLSTASGTAPSYSVRTWVTFDGTGSISIKGSGNVTSVTDLGNVGWYKVNFTTAMPNVNYAAVAMGHINLYGFILEDTRTTSSITVATKTDGGPSQDTTQLSVIIVG